MSSAPDLLKAIRSGRLSEVTKALDAGASIELNDGVGEPGLPFAMACFLGHTEIVRELAIRGAKVNAADNLAPTSPLSMALRGKRTEIVKVLIEFGLDVPAGVDTGLNEHELMLARWKARKFGTGGESAGEAGAQDDLLHEVEEIKIVTCYGTSTDVLNADMRHAIEEMDKAAPETPAKR